MNINKRNTMSNSNLNDERRKREQRRQTDGGPPAGVQERRINIERRLFNLGVDCGKAWLDKPVRDEAGQATPLASGFSASR